MPTTVKSPIERALDLLAENLDAWEGEEESVQDEHADLISRTRDFLEAIRS